MPVADRHNPTEKSEPGAVEDHDSIPFLLKGYMGVYHGSVELGMAEELGDTLDLDPLIVQDRGKGVAEGMAVNIPAAKVFNRVFLHHVMPGAAIQPDKKRLLIEIVAVLREILFDDILKPGGQRHNPLLAPLAGDPHEAPGQVDIAHPEIAHLRYPQARMGHEVKAEEMPIAFDVFEENINFFGR